MDKIIDGILTAVYLVLLTAGSGYRAWKLESSTRIMTGGKLDF